MVQGVLGFALWLQEPQVGLQVDGHGPPAGHRTCPLQAHPASCGGKSHVAKASRPGREMWSSGPGTPGVKQKHLLSAEIHTPAFSITAARGGAGPSLTRGDSCSISGPTHLSFESRGPPLWSLMYPPASPQPRTDDQSRLPRVPTRTFCTRAGLVATGRRGWFAFDAADEPACCPAQAIASPQGLQKDLGCILPGHLQPPAKALSPTSSPLRLMAAASSATPHQAQPWPWPLQAVDSASSDTEIRPSTSPCLEKKPHPSQSFPGQFPKRPSLPR
ncbi:uncharacterized protein LOC122430980 isoform X1 [Cervus canadensis]|uniref:uncharacterized protein LOC122430980 isoform X1 n=1 Tax=Cervus canadensis TaxID=1574408 RepID=UPI001CA35CBE|nr:uncharacterized protein LOC122430980 isoform X1 [Cervus canadensis]